MAKTTGDVIVEKLMAWGVDTVFGFPGDGIAIALTLDASGRIARETYANPGHLIARGFAYPEK